MRTILIYDITDDKCDKIKKICGKYLHRIQNSVFEGDITESYMKKLINELKKIYNKEKDSIIIYTINNPNWLNKTILGIEKNEIDNFL